ncbi:amidohydrolase [Spiractinospora alimapuensis]|uniref:nitrilase-related carbon-nitrogen hydrolase n=1 Tax=Spiractinospora alimapuensis TaxID=2820884 RepID=UPI001F2662DA|nr:nitrilase-related carbon-nitrogen hydrolase [Spiractinospora alimapuensis]QVQ50177.1 amidohydrolase [Spiractinospora alimapuensis]
MRVAIAQTDCVLGDVEANLKDARARIEDAASQGADLVVFPELALHGYALGQLDEDTSLRADDERLLALGELGPDVLIGFYERRRLRHFNSAAYLSRGGITSLHHKLYLPNYLMWEERKHFFPGRSIRAFDTDHGRAATVICNDAWQPMVPWLAAQDGAEILFVPTNSAAVGGVDGDAGPLDNNVYWQDLVRQLARMQQCYVIFANRVGQENGVSFWGGSQIVDPFGTVLAEAPLWRTATVTAEIDVAVVRRQRHRLPLLQDPRFDLLNRELERLVETDEHP